MPTTLQNLQHYPVRRALLFMVVTAALTAGFVAIDRLHTVSSSPSAPPLTVSPVPPLNPLSLGVRNPPQCGSQLGFADYSVTLRDTDPSATAFRTALGLDANDVDAEFMPLSGQASVMATDPAGQSLTLDRVRLVRMSVFTSMGSDAVVSKLQAAPEVATVEPVWLQSSDRRYLSCDYKLRDNVAAQAAAQVARQALVEHGVNSATLDDPGTMEYVSVRHFSGQAVLQVAFVRRPVGGPSVAYVALLTRSGSKVLAVARANWYQWG